MATTPNPATVEWVPLWDLEGSSGGGSLPANIAFTDAANVFTLPQTLPTGTIITDPSKPVDHRKWKLWVDSSEVLMIDPVNDAEVSSGKQLQLGRDGTVLTNGNLSVVGQVIASSDYYTMGGYYEYMRNVRLGHWQNVPFNAANFSALSPMTWTVGSAAMVNNRFCIIGKTMIWSFYVSWFSGGNILGGTASNTLYMIIPNNASVPVPLACTIAYQGGTAGVNPGAGLVGSVSNNRLEIQKADISNFAVGSAPGMIATVIFEIS